MTKTVSDFLHFQKQIEKYASELELENERYLGKNQNPKHGNHFTFKATLTDPEEIPWLTEDRVL